MFPSLAEGELKLLNAGDAERAGQARVREGDARDGLQESCRNRLVRAADVDACSNEGELTNGQ